MFLPFQFIGNILRSAGILYIFGILCEAIQSWAFACWIFYYPDAGKDLWQEEKGTTEYEMVGWHHQLDGHEFEQPPGVGDGQGSLACFSPWGCSESDTTERLN